MKGNPPKVLEKTMQAQDPIKTKNKKGKSHIASIEHEITLNNLKQVTEDSDLIPLEIWFHVMQPYL